MAKFVYFTDFHYGSNPVSRKDNYNKSLLNKLEFVLKYAKKHNLTVLHGGDLFDKPIIPMNILLDLISMLLKYKDVRFISLRGNNNHDGHIEHSPLRLLDETSVIETSDYKDYIDFDDCRIIFADNNTDPNTRDEHLSKSKYNILMTHHIIVENPTIYNHHLISELKTKANLVLIADYHPKQGIITRDDGVIFVSPGAMARRKRTKHEINRVPNCVFIDTETEKIEMIDVPVEHDIWSNDKMIVKPVEVDTKEHVKMMCKLIDDEDVFNGSISNLIEGFAKKVKVGNNVLKFILKRLEDGKN